MAWCAYSKVITRNTRRHLDRGVAPLHRGELTRTYYIVSTGSSGFPWSSSLTGLALGISCPRRNEQNSRLGRSLTHAIIDQGLFRVASESGSQRLTGKENGQKQKGSGIKFRQPPPATTWNQTHAIEQPPRMAVNYPLYTTR